MCREVLIKRCYSSDRESKARMWDFPEDGQIDDGCKVSKSVDYDTFKNLMEEVLKSRRGVPRGYLLPSFMRKTEPRKNVSQQPAMNPRSKVNYTSGASRTFRTMTLT